MAFRRGRLDLNRVDRSRSRATAFGRSIFPGRVRISVCEAVSEIVCCVNSILIQAPARPPEAPRLSPVPKVQPLSFRVPIGGQCEPVLVQYCELVHRRFPIVGCSPPVLGDVAQGQPDQLGGRIVAGEVSSGLDDPPMATSNSPTFGQSNSPMAGRSDYDVSSLVTMRAAASLRR